VLKRKDGRFEIVDYKHSPALAVMEDMVFKQRDFQLEPGDTIFVYTDGVPEATDASNELFGTERMLETLNAQPDASVEEILHNIKDGIDAFVKDAPQFDDITMLAFHYKGSADSAE
jgi:sigma-B regulation protein RsbU (phosphoserine phosphatase)